MRVDKAYVSAVRWGQHQFQASKAFFANDLDYERLSLFLSVFGDIVRQGKELLATLCKVRLQAHTTVVA